MYKADLKISFHRQKEFVMPTNIESFVAKLKTEGVDAGKQAAQEIENKANEQAEQIIAKANKNAEQIIAKANNDAQKIQERMQSSLELASRDALLLLQQKLSELLNALLAQEAKKQLSDEETLANVMREIILSHAKNSTQGPVTAEIHVPKETQSRLVTGALRELTRALKSKDIQAEVKSSLEKAGFEYKIEGCTVEISADSVTALLTDLIDPQLRKFLAQAAADKKQ